MKSMRLRLNLIAKLEPAAKFNRRWALCFIGNFRVLRKP